MNSKTKRHLWRSIIIFIVAIAVLTFATVAVTALDDAHSYNLTWRGATDTVNGAKIYAFTPTDSTGTGYWHSFLRVSASNMDIVKGWNSDYKQEMQFQEDPSWTSSFLLKDVPQVMVEGDLYREFQLDINQNSNDTSALLSIDELEVYLINLPLDADGIPYLDDATSPLVTYPFDTEIAAGDMDFVWGLDQVDDNVILLNFGLNPGSGKRDFKIQIPNELFDTGYNCVILYAEHGGDAYTGMYDLDADPATTGDQVTVTNAVYPNNDGFEEWGVTKYPATKLGTKFNDLNADGVWDQGEPGLAGWTIYVDYNGNGILEAGEPFDVTDAAGEYMITGIEPGTYDVREVQQLGWACSFPAGGYYADEEFGNGAYLLGNNFGNYLTNVSIDITKTGDMLSKVGDSVTYTIAIENTGDLTLEHISVVDTVLGDLSAFFADTLAPGASESHDFPYTIQADDPDPLPNTVTVHSDPIGAVTTDVTDSASHSVNLFQPSINVVKTGDGLSKIGDTVNYTITVYNDSSADTPEMAFDITDTKLGINLQDVVIANGGTYVINKPFVIPADASDPYVNTVNVHATVAGFPNTYDDSDSWSTNLFQPAIDVEKTGDALSKIGDTVNYTITVYNNSSADTPEMAFDITDTKLGINLQDVVIANGGTYVINKPFVIPADASDPYVNTVNVHATVAGFPNTYDDSDSWSTNLFQPAIDIVKTGDELSKIGDLVDYTITVYNDSSADTPTMYFDISDPMLGIDLNDVVIANGGTHVINVNDFVIPADAADPYVNEVDVHATVAGFPNTYDDSDSWSTNLFQPSITLTKVGSKSEALPGEWIHYIVTVTNTSSADSPNLVGTVVDSKKGTLGPINLAPGGQAVFEYDMQMPMVAPGTYHNIATVTASPVGFPNIVSATDDWEVLVRWYGFTPGYWKTHPEQWYRTAYTPNMLVRDIFTIPTQLLTGGKLDLNKDGIEDTLMVALNYMGGNDLKGKAQILLRAAVAALLNESALGDGYPPYATTADLIAAVNTTLATVNKGAYTTMAATLDHWNNGIHEFPD